MRNPDRIPGILDRVAHEWYKVPDWRLSQFMINVMLAYSNKYGHDAFYAEDEEFTEFIKDFIKEATGDA